jgi:hypothetical protein
MWGVPHIITYNDLIAAGAQGKLAAYAGDQDGRCCGINGDQNNIKKSRFWRGFIFRNLFFGIMGKKSQIF